MSNEMVKQKTQSPAEMINLAIEKGSNLDQLEKLLALKEKFEANEARKAFHKAMAEFKANPPDINKDKKVGYKTDKGPVGYSHASLYNVTKKINSSLSKYGLSASWTTKQNGIILVTCKITHELGHSEETTLSAPADMTGSKNAIQAIGSTISYLERYTLLALTGLATYDMDDDGKIALVEYVSLEEGNKILDLIVATKTDMKKFLTFMKVENLETMPKSEYKKAMAALEAKMKVVK